MAKKRTKKENEFITAAALIVIGALFLIFKGEVISIAISLIGFTLIALGIIGIIRKNILSGIVEIVFGVLVLTAGWLFIELALYILGAFLLIAGATQLFALTKLKIKKMTLPVIMHIIQPIIYILVAICLFFNQGGAISWVFTVSGIFLIIDGIVGVVGALDK